MIVETAGMPAQGLPSTEDRCAAGSPLPPKKLILGALASFFLSCVIEYEFCVCVRVSPRLHVLHLNCARASDAYGRCYAQRFKLHARRPVWIGSHRQRTCLRVVETCARDGLYVKRAWCSASACPPACPPRLRPVQPATAPPPPTQATRPLTGERGAHARTHGRERSPADA